jgi:hypothetical protein
MRVRGPRTVEVSAVENRIGKFNLPDVGIAHIRFHHVALRKEQNGFPFILAGLAFVLLGDALQLCVVDQAFATKVQAVDRRDPARGIVTTVKLADPPEWNEFFSKLETVDIGRDLDGGRITINLLTAI